MDGPGKLAKNKHPPGTGKGNGGGERGYSELLRHGSNLSSRKADQHVDVLTHLVFPQDIDPDSVTQGQVVDVFSPVAASILDGITLLARARRLAHQAKPAPGRSRTGIGAGRRSRDRAPREPRCIQNGVH